MKPGRHSAARRRALAGCCVLIAALAVSPATAWGHGLLIAKRDLAIPEWLFAWAASLVLIVSFVALSMLWRTPRFESEGWRPLRSRVWGALVGAPVRGLCGAVGAALLLLVVYAGLNGTEAPDRNFSVTFVFVTFWLGFVLVSVLFGDLFRAFNPWRAIAEAVAGVFRLAAGQPARAPLRYPEWLGRWPAAIGLLAFGWFELVYGTPGAQAIGLTPQSVAVAAIVYSAITLVAMAMFGIETWLSRGETFSVYFGMFARLSPLELRDGQLGRRRFLTGLPSWSEVPGSTALILAVIGITVYDGASEGVLSQPFNDTLNALVDSGVGPVAALRLSGSLYFTICVAAVAALFWAGIRGMGTIGPRVSTAKLARTFAHSFVPIALAYLVAHYFSLAVFGGQAQFGFLLSDPLGDGSDLFGTAGGAINYSAVSSETVWYVQVGALVTGHVLALVLGHDRALAYYGDPKRAARSQYWMLAMMVAFTSLGLYLLSQGNA